ncbi:hypothetical protein P691DRAFT_767278 [Macrolepiota fuliginosa MF-IS2]|uniref:Uncharacterized protein n=1 Tax=Macrolepiota fuliginosa MF-IS2 TaxID=1400762 RepID=A0A9P6BWQ2_9AGAR|nr:hypothetical protein P691DRAFT_767278 [Macrolepiota fuliginosa MF-IS2]
MSGRRCACNTFTNLTKSPRYNDHNPSISYFSSLESQGTSSWSHDGSSNEFNHTVSHAIDVGSGASIAFSGTSIAIFGTISQESFDQPNPTTQYVLDAKAPVIYHTQASTKVQYQVPFYRSSYLVDGPHTLEIMITDAGNLWLDYLEITGNPPAVLLGGDSSPANSINATQAITSNQSQPSAGPSVPGRNPPTNSTTAQTTTLNQIQHPTPGPSTVGSGSRPETPTGTIVSGILGGHLGLIILFLLVLYIRRRRSRKRLRARDSALSSTSSAPLHPQVRQSSPQSVVPFRLSTLVGSSGGIENAPSGTSTSDVAGMAAPIHKRQTPAPQPQDDPPPHYHSSEVGGLHKDSSGN